MLENNLAPSNISSNVFACSKNTRYECRVVAKDYFNDPVYSSLADISPTFVFLHLAKSMLSIGIGRLCNKTNALQIGLKTYFDDVVDVAGGLNVSGTTNLGKTPPKVAVLDNTGWVHYRTPEELWADMGSEKALLDMAHPIGSIYRSVNATNPATLFGGTWEQIKDCFLLSAGDTYAAGSTGGEATHKLTVAEMPAPKPRCPSWVWASSTRLPRGATSSTTSTTPSSSRTTGSSGSPPACCCC